MHNVASLYGDVHHHLKALLVTTARQATRKSAAGISLAK